MAYLILIVTIAVLVFAWMNMVNRKRIPAKELVYLKGSHTHPDSDADMQQQYDRKE